MFCVGQKVIYNNEEYIIQDTDRMSGIVWIGKPDDNNLVWDKFWVDTERVTLQ